MSIARRVGGVPSRQILLSAKNERGLPGRQSTGFHSWGTNQQIIDSIAVHISRTTDRPSCVIPTGNAIDDQAGLGLQERDIDMSVAHRIRVIGREQAA